jgi:hypothetical protein
LHELVRDADVEWARALGERPCFEQVGSLTDPADPYTVESVRTRLTALLKLIETGA